MEMLGCLDPARGGAYVFPLLRDAIVNLLRERMPLGGAVSLLIGVLLQGGLYIRE